MRILLSILLLALPFTVGAATWTASSGSVADVQSAVNSSSNGDTVLIPASTNWWDDDLVVTKAIHLTAEDGYGTVHIYKSAANAAQGDSNQRKLIEWAPAAYGGLLSDLHLYDTNNVSDTRGVIWVRSAIGGVISNIYASTRYAAVRVGAVSNAHGVTTSSYFHQYNRSDSGNFNAFDFRGDTNQWNIGADTLYGTTNRYHVENCIIDCALKGNGAFDAYNGAIFVWRYNTMTNTFPNTHDAATGGFRGTHSAEIYGNSIVNDGYSNMAWPMELRLGTALVFSNATTTINSGTWSKTNIVLRVYRADGSYSPWGQATGSNIWDENADGFGWAALDQIGRTGPTTYDGVSNGQTGQVSLPLYYWDNTIDGYSQGVQVQTAAEANFIKDGRDATNAVYTAGSYAPLQYPHPLVGEAAPASAPAGSSKRARLTGGPASGGSGTGLGF